MKLKLFKNVNDDFAREVMKIKDPVEFFGVVKILGIKVMKESGELKTGEELILDVLDEFTKKPRKFRKELVKILKDSNMEEKVNGDSTENTEETVSSEEVQ